MRGYTYYFDRDYFQDIDHQSKAYWLGYIAADGGMCDDRPRLDLDSSDRVSVENYKTDLNAEKKILVTTNKGFISFRLSLTNKGFVDSLVRWNIVPNKSLILKPPVRLPKEMIRHWIRGYFDGDGCISIKNKASVRFTGTRGVLGFIVAQLPTDKPRSIRPNKGVWHIRTSKLNDIRSIYSYFYNDAIRFLPRKKEKFDIHLQRMENK